MNLPEMVSPEVWEAANEQILAKEKALTRQLDALAAERRRQPMMRIEKGYEFQGAHGPATLRDLFQGRRQLFVYNFMFGPNQEVGCDGCSMVVDQLTHLAHLQAHDTSSPWLLGPASASSSATGSGWAGTSRGTPGAMAPTALSWAFHRPNHSPVPIRTVRCLA